MVKTKLAALGVALALLALVEPAAAGMKFGKDDLKSEKSLWRLYQRWGARFNVTRDPVEKHRRFENFKDTARRVHRRAAAGQAPGLNIFADLSHEEFSRDYTCRDIIDDRRNAPPVKIRRGGNGTLPLPGSVNWRTRSCNGQPCLGPVKFQGTCGSCWAFAATGALESRNAIRADREQPGPSATSLQLSEQELVDCDTQSIGCKGGLAVNAFNYIVRNGLASSAAYPYRGNGGTCQAATTPRADLLVRGYQRTPPNDEFQLLQAVIDGPVAVSVGVGHNNTQFRDYEGGLYRGPCRLTQYHAMLLVGYESEYYILKNSYGEDWGDDGYLFLSRGGCGILRRGGSYPEMGLI